MEERSLKHWTTREVQVILFLKADLIIPSLQKRKLRFRDLTRLTQLSYELTPGNATFFHNGSCVIEHFRTQLTSTLFDRY